MTFLDVSSRSRSIYGGIGIANLPIETLVTDSAHTNPSILLPRGPSTSTVRKGLFLVTDRVIGGSRSLNSTSGGRDRGTMPIRDVRCEELLKGRVVETLAKAGNRKSGKEDTLRY